MKFKSKISGIFLECDNVETIALLKQDETLEIVEEQPVQEGDAPRVAQKKPRRTSKKKD